VAGGERERADVPVHWLAAHKKEAKKGAGV